MRTHIVLCVSTLILASSCRAQFEQGRSEIGLTTSIGPGDHVNTFFGAHDDYRFASNYYFSLSTVYDYYVLPGLSLEPEASMTWYKEARILLLLANLSYSHRLGQSPVALFGRIGCGVSNDSYKLSLLPILTRVLPGRHFMGIAYGKTCAILLSKEFISIGKSITHFDAGILNAGVGAKIFLGARTLLRLELNYRSFTWNEAGSAGISTGISFVI